MNKRKKRTNKLKKNKKNKQANKKLIKETKTKATIKALL